MSVEIVELSRSRRDVSRFLRIPYAIYRDDPLWVAPLLSDLTKVFTDANPLFEHAQMRLWVARRAGRDVGRMAGILDHAHNEFHHERTAFFGFFESIDDAEVSGALFDAVGAWAAELGMSRILGPMNPTTNDECGLLVDGFERRPVLMMTYNPRYYVKLVEAAGCTKAQDLLAYNFEIREKPMERLRRLAQGVRRREPELTVRPLRKKHLVRELGKVKEVYNAAWEANWGFVPMTDADIDFMAARLKPLVVEDLLLLAEVKGEPVAFMLSMPDYNEALQPLRGRLLSWGLPRFLAYMLGWKVPHHVRVLTLGIKKGFRQRGIDAALFEKAVGFSLKAGYKECEVSWLLESNTMVIRHAEFFGATRYKTYRIYEKAV